MHVVVTGISVPAAKIARDIASYLRINPLACDTREGIWRWWLRGDGAEPSEVATALEWLTSEGIVEAQAAADGRVRYRRAALEARAPRPDILTQGVSERGSTLDGDGDGDGDDGGDPRNGDQGIGHGRQ
jgi:hypothetical protein